MEQGTTEEVSDEVAYSWMAAVGVLKCAPSPAISRMHVTEVTRLPSKEAAPIYLPPSEGDSLFPTPQSRQHITKPLRLCHMGRESPGTT